jgi:hypothetical protein
VALEGDAAGYVHPELLRPNARPAAEPLVCLVRRRFAGFRVADSPIREFALARSERSPKHTLAFRGERHRSFIIGAFT